VAVEVIAAHAPSGIERLQLVGVVWIASCCSALREIGPLPMLK